MKAALLFVVAGVALCASFARAADGPYRRIGYEIGGWRWTTDQGGHLEGSPSDAFVLSVGRWRRLSRAVTWVTRLEYGDLMDIEFPASWIPEHFVWADVGRSVTVETGLALHPPVKVGLAPYVGLNLGAGVAHLGNRHEAHLTGEGWVVTTHARGRLAPAVVAAAEIGLRVFSKRGWPGVCAALGSRFVVGPHGGGFTTEPVLSIGY